jgi:hypothetical protein
MFGNWLNGVDRQSKTFMRIGVSSLCWSIWRARNDIIFNKKTFFSLCAGYPYGVTLGSVVGSSVTEDQRDAMATVYAHGSRWSLMISYARLAGGTIDGYDDV